MLGGRILLSRLGQDFEIGQPTQRLLPRFTTHFPRRLQAGTALRPLRATKNATAQFAVEMTARFARGLVQRGNRRCDTAGATSGTAIHHRRMGGTGIFWHAPLSQIWFLPFFTVDRINRQKCGGPPRHPRSPAPRRVRAGSAARRYATRRISARFFLGQRLALFRGQDLEHLPIGLDPRHCHFGHRFRRRLGQ